MQNNCLFIINYCLVFVLLRQILLHALVQEKLADFSHLPYCISESSGSEPNDCCTGHRLISTSGSQSVRNIIESGSLLLNVVRLLGTQDNLLSAAGSSAKSITQLMHTLVVRSSLSICFLM